MVANFAALSLVILSNVGVSKKIFTNLILLFHSKSRMDNFDKISTEQMLQIKLTFQPWQCKCNPIGVIIVGSDVLRRNKILYIFQLIRFREACDWESRARRQALSTGVNPHIVNTFQLFWGTQRCLLIIKSDVVRQASTLIHKTVNVLSRCTVVKRFLILTPSNILIKSKKWVRNSYFFENIEIVFSIPNQ